MKNCVNWLIALYTHNRWVIIRWWPLPLSNAILFECLRANNKISLTHYKRDGSWHKRAPSTEVFVFKSAHVNRIIWNKLSAHFPQKLLTNSPNSLRLFPLFAFIFVAKHPKSKWIRGKRANFGNFLRCGRCRLFIWLLFWQLICQVFCSFLSL